MFITLTPCELKLVCELDVLVPEAVGREGLAAVRTFVNLKKKQSFTRDNFRSRDLYSQMILSKLN